MSFKEDFHKDLSSSLNSSWLSKNKRKDIAPQLVSELMQGKVKQTKHRRINLTSGGVVIFTTVCCLYTSSFTPSLVVTAESAPPIT